MKFVFQRVLVLLFFIGLAQQEEEDIDEILKSETFSCSYEIRSNRQSVVCTNNIATITLLSKLYVIELQGVCNSFVLDERCVWNKTIFYVCSAFYIGLVVDDSLLKKCDNYSEYSSSFSEILNASFVTDLSISNNSTLSSISQVLDTYNWLKVVSLQKNYFENLNASLVNIKNRINELSLKDNGIRNVVSDAFRNLPYLKSLDISVNNIQNLTGDIFRYLLALEYLDISSNNIRVLPSDSFRSLSNLRVLLLKSNNISEIESSALHFGSTLDTIDLSHNSLLFSISAVFQNLSSVQNVTCSNCNFVTVDEDMFKDSPNILHIDLSSNLIVSVHKSAFNDLKNLQSLNLAYNEITKISSDLLKQYSLVHLNLTHNRIERLKKKTFYKAMNIRVLDLSQNKLRVFTDEHVKTFINLEFLDLRNNNIDLVELGLTVDVRVRILYLSNNSIVKFNVGWKRLLFLEEIDLSYNELTHIELPPCISNVKQTITFSFHHNNISKIHVESLLKDEATASTDRAMAHCFFLGKAKNYVSLAYNPIRCDCDMYPFYHYSKKNEIVRGRIDFLTDLENLTCKDPTLLQGKKLVSLSDNDFSCSFTEKCPSPCICGVRGKDGLSSLNCSSRNLGAVPQNPPANTTVLYFNSNTIKNITSLNSAVWKKLVELYLDDNILSSLDHWDFPTTLRVLSVKNNKLKLLPVPLARFIEKHDDFQLFVSGNEELCSCGAKDTRDFLLRNKRNIADFPQVLCHIDVSGAPKLVPFFSIPDSFFCPAKSADVGIIVSWLIPVCLALVSSALVIVVFKYARQSLFSLLFAKFGICAREEHDEDAEKVYDAFVAYGSSDRTIVMELLRELEQGHPPNFRLCIHERDWIPGRFINDNILDSVKTSRRTIVVLSETFAASPWFAIELRAAMISETNHIIVIMVDKTTKISIIDPELRDIVVCRTYLVWGERWFWEKLRYAMPHKKCVERRVSETALLPC